MENQHWIKLRSVFLGGMALALVAGPGAFGTALAQEAAADVADDEEEAVEEILVTGSRIRRDEFTSATPIQVLNVQAGRQIGITSIIELLQRSTVANGQQIDATFNSNAGQANATEAPPTGGVGSSNIDLRGLGPERTLILLNGRRLGSAGVRGAPAQPDISLIPFAMVDHVEVVTEGASSIYGADAVAGVVNVILRQDFEGLEISINNKYPQHGGGEIYEFSVVGGASSDRASFVFGAEYFNRTRVATGSRKASQCMRELESTADRKTVFGPCRSPFFDNVILAFEVPEQPGSDIFFFFTPGQTDIGVPNFSTFRNIPGPTAADLVDPESTGRFPLLDFFNDQDERRDSDLVSPLQRFSVVGLTEIELGFGTNTQAYSEFYYLNRQLFSNASTEQIFPDVPGRIPQEDANGNIIVDSDGFPILVDNPLNPFPGIAVPIITLEDIPQTRDVELQQFRFVGGLRGDIGSGWFGERDWAYDVFFAYDRGTGFQAAPILFEPHLDIATQTLRMGADGKVKCGLPPNVVLAGFLTSPDCVPINFFADSLYIGGVNGEGVFASDAERDYLLGNRTNRTVTEQINVAAFITGDLFDIPTGGTVGTAFGAEYRKDIINSQNDITGVKGLNAAENPVQEGETIGSRWIYDIYGEVNIPLIIGREMAELVNIEGAARFTEEENFGSEWTFRGRALYRPNDWIQISGSVGTSFRAPNLREQFLASQGGAVSGGIDVCAVPRTAIVDGVYDRDLDPRNDRVLNNCVLSGADPTRLGEFAFVSIPVTIGGNSTDLKAENSRSYTATVSITQPWTELFDLDIAISYYDIRITDTVEELDPEDIVFRCFNDEDNLTSPFCRRLTRASGGDPGLNFINFIDASFVNIGLQTGSGFDFNTRLRFTLDDVMGAPIDVGWVTATTLAIDQEEQVFRDSPRDDNVGEIGTPKWRFNSTLSLTRGNFEFLWFTRYIGPMQQDDTDTFRDNPLFVGADLTADVDYTRDRWYHDVSATYHLDTVVFTFGVSNLLDNDPPLIQAFEGPNRNNAVTSAGFDLFGRTFFLNATAAF